MAASSTRPGLTTVLQTLTRPKLFPFYSLVLIHFVAQPSDFKEEIHTMTAIVKKIAPIWYLIIYIHTINPPQETSTNSQENSRKPVENSKKSQTESTRKLKENSRHPQENDDSTLKSAHRYFFTAGLVLSSIGDAFMNSPVTFVHAMGTFGPAHAMYVLGLRARRTIKSTRYAWMVYPISCLSFLTIAPGMESTTLMGIVFCYNMIITVMLYHALASLESDTRSVSAWFGAIGALSFVVSDMVIGINKWSIPVPYPNAVIMVTYYFAQLSLALSVY